MSKFKKKRKTTIENIENGVTIWQLIKFVIHFAND